MTLFGVQTPPTPEETGYCDSVYTDEIGETPVIIFKQGVEVKVAFGNYG